VKEPRQEDSLESSEREEERKPQGKEKKPGNTNTRNSRGLLTQFVCCVLLHKDENNLRLLPPLYTTKGNRERGRSKRRKSTRKSQWSHKKQKGLLF
jgi:hypothetical protein